MRDAHPCMREGVVVGVDDGRICATSVWSNTQGDGLAWPGQATGTRSCEKWVEQVREPVALAPLARFKQSAGRMAVVLCRCVLYVVLMNVALPSGAIENGRSASATARKPATAAAGLAASSARHRAAASERPERSVRRTATPDLPNAQPEARAGVPAPT